MKKLEQINIIYQTDKQVIMEFKVNSNYKMPEMCVDETKLKNAKMICYYDDESKEEFCAEEKIKEKVKEWEDAGDISVNRRYILPNVKYTDITECDLLNGISIPEETLISKEHGLWSESGRRKFRIEIDNMDNLPNDKMTKIIFSRINEEECSDASFSMGEQKYTGGDIVAYIDTDALGVKFREEKYKDREYLQFIGNIVITCKDSKKSQVKLLFPICVSLRNTNPEACTILSKNKVSIDFGTSSTCVAIEGGDGKPELLTISPSDESDNDVNNQFENPTNLMIFNWSSLYEKWRAEDKHSNMMRKGDIHDFMSDKSAVDFNFGYEVKKLIGYAGKDEINAILTLIKMVHYRLSKEEKMDINPFAEKDKYVYIVSDPNQQDENHFDPVAFYGYLIGKAINDQSKRENIFCKFMITSPVKFNQNVKNAICKSLEYGLKRSLPLPLRDKMSVEMKFVEPVAYIGAICGTPYFRIEEDEEKLFAVYDFGGGTLDYSYGTISNIEDDLSINIKGVGGNEMFGGEILISQISYQIYLRNMVDMIENKVPFIVPDGEIRPDELPDNLVLYSNYADANVKKISELISRDIFEGRVEEYSEPVVCELVDINGNIIEASLTVDMNQITELLEDRIGDTVKIFADEMDRAFRNINGYNRNNVYIFKAGNSSKSEYVKMGMDKYFPEHPHIQMVDEISDNTKSNKRYAITPKTAVAFGQLKLNNFDVKMQELLFKFYVGYINQGTNEFKPVIERNSSELSWKKFRKIKNDSTSIYFGNSVEDALVKRDIDTENMRGMVVYVRVCAEDSIEYCIVDETQIPDDDVIPAGKIDLTK